MTTQLLNTLYVQTQGTYLRLEGETLRVEVEKELRLQIPLHHLGGLVVFGNVLLSPFLLKRCAEDGRSVVWLSRGGRFVGRLAGPVSGNVLLREAQHAALADPERTTAVARSVVVGKVRAQRAVLMRAAREADGHDEPAIRAAAEALARAQAAAKGAPDVDTVRGEEGQAAAVYFDVFPRLVRAPDVGFDGRTRRPPRDPMNALLSFLYTLVRGDCTAALESVGLDPQVGFLHVLRPGRPALALDLMEEFRPSVADRLALALVNRRQLTPAHFEPRPGGAVYLNEEGRRVVLTAYQERKQKARRHRLFKEPVPWGLLPFVQARLLARHLRGDLPRYPPHRGA
ncbi:type I-C CRISPR-associated endonuclease Cas1c [Rubrivirga sp.]|uniref:type I-C CRISPR-associated endonuclease Cas1c n=1 Tax=Rubrivirga sp. TaxID=1885344 RepID=UPI003B528A2A